MKLTEATRAIQSFNVQVKALLRESGFAEYSKFFPDEYQTNRKTITDEDGYTESVADLTPDEWQLVYEYGNALYKLNAIANRIDYLNKPITHSGQLYITANGRYAVDGQELCCGYTCEHQQYDAEHDCYYWLTDRVEYSENKGGYYFYSSCESLEEGQTVRLRW